MSSLREINSKKIRRLVDVLVFFVVSLVMTGSVLAQALTQDDVNSINNDTVWYDASSGISACSSADLSGTTPGNGDPQGLGFPNLDPQDMANAIDTYLGNKYPTSPFKGLGSVMVATAKHSNLNPFIFVAIAKVESQLATNSSDFNTQPGHYNAFGRMAGPDQPSFMGSRRWYRWESFKASVDYSDPSNNADPHNTGDMGSYIHSVYGDYVSKNDFQGFFTTYAPPSENNTASYISDVKNIFSDIAALAKGGSSSASSDSSTTISGSGCAVCSPSPSSSSAATVVLDPGHAGADTVDADPASGVKAQESTNPEERKNMWNTAQDIKAKLEKAGYKVVLTKNSEDDPAGLIEKARRANESNAAIGVSLHDTPGVFGQIPSQDWGVTPQEVGRFRENQDDGKRKTFDDAALATKSQQYAQIISDERAKTGDKNKVTPLDQSFPKQRGLLAYGDISIIQLMAKIPWVYNEVGQTGFDEGKYADGVANGIMKAVPLASSGSQSSDSGCSGAAAGDAVATAVNFAWPDYKGRDSFDGSTGLYIKMKPSYRAAFQAAKDKGDYVGGNSYPGIDCGGFVSRVMKSSGVDPNYNQYQGPTSAQQKYMDDHPEKYQKLGSRSSTADLKPGDIAITSEHTYMYVGQIARFGGNSASASLDERAPMASSAYFSDTQGTPFTWYRPIKG